LAENIRVAPSDGGKKEQPLAKRKPSGVESVRPASRPAAAKKDTAAITFSQADPRSFDLSANHREQDVLQKANAVQREELGRLRDAEKGLEGERDFYFKKLRQMEILCRNMVARPEPSLTVDKVLVDVKDILYSENDDNGVVREDEFPSRTAS